MTSNSRGDLVAKSNSPSLKLGCSRQREQCFLRTMVVTPRGRGWPFGCVPLVCQWKVTELAGCGI